jgi:hypothetical protein
MEGSSTAGDGRWSPCAKITVALVELLIKITLAPALVILATLSARRWGDAIGGIVIAIPVVAGPILLVLGLEQGAGFVHHAARAAVLGIVAVGAFCVACGRCLHLGWVIAIGVGWLVYGLTAAALTVVDATVWICLGAALAAIAVARRLTPAPPSATFNAAGPPAWDLPARAAATAALVVALTGAASALGPSLSGLLTPFPLATSVVIAFTLSQAGEAAAAHALRGYLTGLPGLAGFCLLVALLTQ